MCANQDCSANVCSPHFFTQARAADGFTSELAAAAAASQDVPVLECHAEIERTERKVPG